MSWISVNDRLPGSENVIAYTNSGIVEAYHDGKQWRDGYTCDGPACYGGIGRVDYWMPIPPLPEDTVSENHGNPATNDQELRVRKSAQTARKLLIPTLGIGRKACVSL